MKRISPYNYTVEKTDTFSKYGKLEIPNQLISAQEQGKLVIFAGAGVSRGSPAKLPDFSNLVKQICKVLPYKDTEPLEKVLGQHCDKGVDVHSLAKTLIEQKMKREGSGCTDLHRSIPKLFRRGDLNSVRVVTTNFDTFLSKAMPEIRSYSAPALPLSSEFSGLVYLHGSIDGDANSLVLTDRDFSRAYMTEGWAREFILNLYEKYTVLFIGYSHEDQLITYLARGMNLRNKKVYAISGDSEDAQVKWDRLGICVIPFPEGNFELLSDSIERWAEEVQSNFFLRKEKFNRILEQRVPDSNSENEDFLKKYLMTSGLTGDFTRMAESSTWCKWVIDNGLADFIHDEITSTDSFSVVMPWKDSQYVLGNWLAGHFIRDTRELNRALKRHGHGVSWPLAHALIACLEREQISSESSLGYLCILLLTQCSHILIRNAHTSLLKVCLKNNANQAALVVLRELLTPKIGMDLYYPDSREEPNLDIGKMELNFNSHMLLKYCLEEEKEFTATFSREIFNICISSLCSVEEMNEGIQEHRYRSWIEVKEVKCSEDTSYIPLAAIACLTVRCMEIMLETGMISNPIAFASNMSCSISPIVRRIAVHLVQVTTDIDGIDKLEWLQKSNLVFSYPEYHEFFLLARELLLNLDETMRSSFLDYLKEFYAVKSGGSEGSTDAYLLDYHIHLAYYLSSSIPDSEILHEHYQTVLEATGLTPSRVKLPEYPSDERETQEYFKSKFQSKPIKELIQYAYTLSGAVKAEYINQLLIAIEKNPWKAFEALRIIDEGQNDPDIDVVGVVFWSFLKLGFSSDQEYSTYLEVLNSERFLVSFHISVIYSVFSRANHNSISDKYMQIEYRVCTAFWKAVKSDSLIVTFNSMYSVDTALSFMSSILCRIVEESKSVELKREVLQFLEEIIESREEHYLPLFRGLGKHLNRMLESEQNWTEGHLSPLLISSPSTNGVAREMWDGFLSMANDRPNERSLQQQAINEALKNNLIRNDGGKLSRILLNQIFTNYSEELVDAMVTAFDEKNLWSFAMHIKFSKEIREQFDHYWNAWVKDYFISRLQSRIKPIHHREFTEILIFAVENPDVYSDLESMLNSYSGDFAGRTADFVKASKISGFHLKNPEIASKYLLKVNLKSKYNNNKRGKLIVNFIEEILHARSDCFFTILPVLEALGMCGIPEAKIVYDRFAGKI